MFFFGTGLGSNQGQGVLGPFHPTLPKSIIIFVVIDHCYSEQKVFLFLGLTMIFPELFHVFEPFVLLGNTV